MNAYQQRDLIRVAEQARATAVEACDHARLLRARLTVREHAATRIEKRINAEHEQATQVAVARRQPRASTPAPDALQGRGGVHRMTPQAARDDPSSRGEAT